MPIDYSSANRVFELAFEKLNTAPVSFSNPGTLSNHIAGILQPTARSSGVIPNDKKHLFASASIEMWHRSVHSFLWSVALTDSSPIWASITGYYASHFVMRAFAHAFGFFNSFTRKKALQIVISHGCFVCSVLPERDKGEHSFYWRVVKYHPEFQSNPLFSKTIYEGNRTSDCFQRNFVNYTDHMDNFVSYACPKGEQIATAIDKIAHYHRFLVTTPCDGSSPHLPSIQILAYQRIVTFREYLDSHVFSNRFWKTHRSPTWCRDLITFQLDDPRPEQLHN